MKSSLIIFLFIISSQVFGHAPNSFSTGPDDQIEIYGFKCLGGEASEVSDRTCELGQWLVSMEQGPFFIAKLKNAEIIPRDTVNSGQRRLLNRYLVDFGSESSLRIVRRIGK